MLRFRLGFGSQPIFKLKLTTDLRTVPTNKELFLCGL